MGLGWDASGHIVEALGLAITVGSLAVRIMEEGGKIGAFVMDSLNFIANLTSTPPSRQMDVVLRLLTHEFGAYMEIWIVLREAYGKFANVKNWQPHVTAKHKRITHDFTRSALGYPPTEESKRALSFLSLYQECGGTQQHDGSNGDKLVGVVVRSAGSVRNAVPWGAAARVHR